ncbi:MAG: hypothetical protein WCJ95_15620 [Mariniphaga sp.]
MIRIICLLAPVFVSLFWSMALMSNKKECSTPRLFLSRFMLLIGMLFAAHFLYFAPFPDLYRYTDVPLQLFAMISLPLYHIYFRLLTVEDEFSIKKHAKYLIVPTVVAMIYGTGVLFTPADEYLAWLFDPPQGQPSSAVQFLTVMRIIIRLTYSTELALSVAGNYWLILKHSDKAEQFYSHFGDAKLTNAKKLIMAMLVMGIGSGIITVIGRNFIMHTDWLVYTGWTLFAVLLFIIGNSGIQQKMINPCVELFNHDQHPVHPFLTSITEQDLFYNKIRNEFIQNKIYLNSELNIMDLVKTIGTNRSYVSAVINQQSNQNFCAFVNNFRIEELERAILHNPESNNEEFALSCGFGSVISLKRAVYARSGVSFLNFKRQILQN